jgi:hypothetical protein
MMGAGNNSIVFPANAGTPYRKVSHVARWQTPFTIANGSGYGSRRSPGRRTDR